MIADDNDADLRSNIADAKTDADIASGAGVCFILLKSKMRIYLTITAKVFPMDSRLVLLLRIGVWWSKLSRTVEAIKSAPS